jgi:hypothetical protein
LENNKDVERKTGAVFINVKIWFIQLAIHQEQRWELPIELGYYNFPIAIGLKKTIGISV